MLELFDTFDFCVALVDLMFGEFLDSHFCQRISLFFNSAANPFSLKSKNVLVCVAELQI